MSEYTAEDFANARFAEHENGRAAMRPQPGRLWHLGSVHMEDHEMAENGWRPVVEADHPARPLAGYRAQVKELREKVRDLERAPLTLDTLREAWENADRLRGCNPGDTLIERLDPDVDAFTIYRADYSANAQALPDTIRVLHRAPQPWQELADVLDDSPPWVERWRADEAARWLHERGVRVVGGDDDE